MAGPDHVFGATRLYTRETENDAWVDRTSRAFFDSPIAQKAGGISSLAFELRYGPGTPAGSLPVLYKHWVMVTHQPDGGSETLVWFGNIEDARMVEEAQVVQWTAVSIEGQLARIRLSETYADTTDNLLLTCARIHRLQFNDELDSAGNYLVGRRSTTKYHFRPSEYQYRSFSAPPGDVDDWAYVFGVDSTWSASDILRLLLAIYAPVGGGPACPIGFYPTISAAAQIYMDASNEAWDFKGRTLYDAVGMLVRRSGPLMWWTDAADYLNGVTDYVHLYVASRLFEEMDATIQTAHNISTSPPEDSPALASVIRGSLKNRVTEVIARGAPLKVMFTIDFDSESMPHYEKGWADELATDWVANRETINADKSKWADVYTRLIVPYNQTAVFENSWKIGLVPFIGGVSNPPGNRIETGLEPLAHMYSRPRRFLPSLLTYRGWTNPAHNETILPIPPDDDPAQIEQDPVLCWHVPPTIGGSDQVRRIRGIRVLQEQAGVRLPLRYRDADSEAPVDLSLGTQWQHLKITVAVELDVCLEWREQVAPWDDDQRRVEVIHLPECEWWAARDETIIDIDADGTETYAYGVLRNDLPILKAAAEARVALVSRRIGGGGAWPDIFARIPLKWVSLTYGVGDFIEVYGGTQIHTPVAEIVHETRDDKEYGTTLITDRARRRGDKP